VIASVLVGSNWALFIWATMSGHVLDAALGYYVVPLLSVALGVVVLKERLRKLQWVALSISALGVLYVTVDYGSLPLIGLGLASTWAVYGYVKKLAGVDAIESLAVESALLTPLAMAYLVYLAATDEGTFGRYGVGHALFLVGAGIFTASPLLLYGAAVVRAPLSTIGFLQYISSTIQFGLGVWVFHEPMDFGRFIGFAITWVALGVLSYDAIHSHRGLPATAVAEPD
jgi:chloramphenicol-sensitive protein RarD